MRCLALSNRFMKATARSLGRHLFSAFSATQSRCWRSVIASATRGPVACCGSLQHQVAAKGSMSNNNGQKVVSRTDLYKGKFLKLTKVVYTRPGSDQLFPWEAAERTTTSRAGVDAVAVLALVFRSGERPQVVIVKQFRPPTSKHTIELPAGLIDEGETPETAALRELKEETGYSGTVLAVSGVQYQSPGLTNECIQTVLVKVDGDAAENKHPPQMLEESEFIDVELMPFDNMTESLKKFEEQGYAVFTGLSSLALGLQLPILLSGMGL